MRKNSSTLLLGFALLIVSAFYYSLKNIPLRIWDESIYANHAIEMAQSGNYFSYTIDGENRFYNTKPPLVIWIQAMATGGFGINELAIRLPSLIALLGISLAIVIFSKRNKLAMTAQFTWLLILFTSRGFMGPHVAATGDLDAMFTLWTTCLTLTIFDLILNKKNIQGKLWLTGLFFLLAFFTKSTATLLIFPGLILALLVTGNLRSIIFTKTIYAVLISVTIPILLFYIIANQQNPGYFHAAWNSEFKRFYVDVMPWHRQPWSYYFENFPDRFSPWIYFLLPAFIFPFIKKGFQHARLLMLTVVVALSYLVMISIPADKLEWYDAPVYPLVSLLPALFLDQMLNLLAKGENRLPRFICMGAFLVLCAFLFKGLIDYDRSEPGPLEKEGAFIKNIYGKIPLHHAQVLMNVEHREHLNQLNFYRKKYAAEDHSVIDWVPFVNEIKLNDTLVVCQADKKDSIHLLFIADTLRSERDCLLLRIIGKR